MNALLLDKNLYYSHGKCHFENRFITTYFRLMYAITIELKPQLGMRKCINKVIRRNFEKTLLRIRSRIKLSSSLNRERFNSLKQVYAKRWTFRAKAKRISRTIGKKYEMAFDK